VSDQGYTKKQIDAFEGGYKTKGTTMKKAKLQDGHGNKMTAKQAAASIIYYDLEKTQGYWSESWDCRYPNIDGLLTEDQQLEIQAAVDKILEPFLERIGKICKRRMLEIT